MSSDRAERPLPSGGRSSNHDPDAGVDTIECFFRAVVEAVSEGVLAVTRGGAIRYLNPAAEAIFDAGKSAYLGLPIEVLLPPTDRRRRPVSAAVVRWLRRRRAADIDIVVGSGQLVPVAVNAVDAVVGGETLLVLTLRIITIRRAAERKVRESEARLARLLDIADDAIVSADSRHRITLFNKGAERIFGFTAEEVLGRGLEMLLPVEIRHDHAGWMQAFAFAPVPSRMMGERAEVIGRRKDGSHFPAEASISHFTQGGATTFTAVLRDISMRKQTEEKLRAATAEAERANRAKSDFLAGMSHELRTPLNAIIGFADMIRTETMGPVANTIYLSYATDILTSGQHLLDMINDILDFMKIDAGKLVLQWADLDVRSEVETCLRMMRPSMAKAGLHTTASFAPDVHVLRGDAKRFKQILLNLLSNAVKFTPAGGSVTIAAEIGENGDLLLTVRDTGIGIAAEDLATVMEPFRQVPHALARDKEGTGLGLPLTKRLVEMHGGSLVLESAADAGTTVTLRFPGIERWSTAVDRNAG